MIGYLPCGYCNRYRIGTSMPGPWCDGKDPRCALDDADRALASAKLEAVRLELEELRRG